jgi:hypothetical protein
MPRQPALKPTIAELRRGGKVAHLPEPGYFRLKRIRGGPWIPALIWAPCPMVLAEPRGELVAIGENEFTEPPEYWCRPADPWRGPRWLRATIGDDEVDPLDVWQWGSRITAAEYHHRMALREWAIRHAPQQPEALPRQRVNLTRQPSLL